MLDINKGIFKSTSALVDVLVVTMLNINSQYPYLFFKSFSVLIVVMLNINIDIEAVVKRIERVLIVIILNINKYEIDFKYKNS